MYKDKKQSMIVKNPKMKRMRFYIIPGPISWSISTICFLGHLDPISTIELLIKHGRAINNKTNTFLARSFASFHLSSRGLTLPPSQSIDFQSKTKSFHHTHSSFSHHWREQCWAYTHQIHEASYPMTFPGHNPSFKTESLHANPEVILPLHIYIWPPIC